jgi:MFS family permease
MSVTGHSDAARALRPDAATAPPARVDSYVIGTVVASMLGYALDTFDNLLISFVLVAISAEMALSPSAAGSIATITLLGAVAGGIVFGVLSDYLGRIRVLTWTIVMFAVFTGLCAVARGYWDLLAYRALAGMGIGGEWGIGMALVAEACPAEMRARFSSLVGIGGTLGLVLVAFVTPALFPLVGWRGMFLIGILPALMGFGLRRLLPEPAIFTRHVREARAAHPLRLLVANAAQARISLGMFILCSVQNFGFYGLMIWLPTYLSSRFGYSLTKSSLWTAVTALGMVIGIWTFGQIADRVGRRPSLIGYQLGAFLMVILYSRLSDPTALLVCGGIMGFFVNGMLGGYGTLMSELYPTEARATAQSVLYNMGRAVGGFGPLVVGAIAAHYSFAVAIALLSTIYLADVVATALLIPERRGTALG